jgi:hypothetical protein
MTWTITNLIIQTVAGLLGAHAAAGISHDHHFGFAGHTLAGLVGGALSGTFLQTLLIGLQTDAFMAPRPPEVWAVQAIAGAAAGAVLQLVLAFTKKEVEQHRSGPQA